MHNVLLPSSYSLLCYHFADAIAEVDRAAEDEDMGELFGLVVANNKKFLQYLLQQMHSVKREGEVISICKIVSVSDDLLCD